MSLYLKYRPQDFDNLMWQTFVKDTLKKAISSEKTVGAYLLCWPRWTWKTTTARLLAKTINCLNQKDWNPCMECVVCKWFNDDNLVDIIEIDAASHTWVDNIRDIIERAQFSPTFTKYKIYIIDEVHMLSKGAFNALLKILEEPPKHVKFILATTETHKVPETIISRCQRYDFKRINENDIKNRINYIAEKEKVSIDEKSLDYIVSNSGWWLRNAISLFEQLITDWNVSFEDVILKMWLVSSDLLKNVLNKLFISDKTVILDLESIINDWKNLKLFVKELIFYTKKTTFSNLENDLSRYILILDELDTAYSKSKNSLDENTTLIIWFLKIVSNYKKPINIIEEKQSWLKIENIKEKNKVEKNEEIIEKVEEIKHIDIFDIFNENNDEKVEDKNQENTNFTDFDTSKFISFLKTSGAKWALTMALRWSTLKISGDKLDIKPTTSIARKNVENTDNIAIMKKSLDEMWFNIEINII